LQVASSTLHVVFIDAGAPDLREALSQLGRDDRVVAFPDNLSFGPIAPSDPASRAHWIAQQLDEHGWEKIVPQVEQFWAAVLAPEQRHVVWFSRRETRDYAGFLEYLRRVGDRPCEVVDLTETLIVPRAEDGRVYPQRRAICIGIMNASAFIDQDLLSRAMPLDDDSRTRYLAEWENLRRENAPLRIVAPDLKLTSVPLTYFDAELLRRIRPTFLKSARIIGDVMSRSWDADIYDVSDFFLSRRLMALAKAGLIESQGDLRRMRYSEVRLPQSPVKV
jgi:DNA-binding transcriptional ArsR family regulator